MPASLTALLYRPWHTCVGQQIDAISEAYLAALVQRVAGAAMLLVPYRPGYQPPWLAWPRAAGFPISPLPCSLAETQRQ